MKIRFWGTRGSIPTPGAGTLRYGGNTSCVEVRIGDHLLIFDAGTGIRKLGEHLREEFGTRPLTVHLFISHTHWDHIQGFPFFLPAYQKQTSLHIYGPPGRDKPLEKILHDQMDADYFPVSLGDLTPNISVHEMRHPISIGEVSVEPFYLNHPAMTLAYRVAQGPLSMVYATDNEPYTYTLVDPAGARGEPSVFGASQDMKFVEFLGGTDLYIAEAQYTIAEYLESKIGWGHSPLESVAQFAVQANVRRLVLFHHDPAHDDAFVDSMVERVKTLLRRSGKSIECMAAYEGLELEVG
jgi:phosphoribosyl 1,2-cyclic phosphodiesterase